jgi:hypothetical protein
MGPGGWTGESRVRICGSSKRVAGCNFQPLWLSLHLGQLNWGLCANSSRECASPDVFIRGCFVRRAPSYHRNLLRCGLLGLVERS